MNHSDLLGPAGKHDDLLGPVPSSLRELVSGDMTPEQNTHFNALKNQGYPENYAKLMAKAPSRPAEIYAEGHAPSGLEMAGTITSIAFGPEMAAKAAIEEGASRLDATHPHIASAMRAASSAIPTSLPQKAAMAAGGAAIDKTWAAAIPVAKGAISVMSQKLGGVSETAVKMLEDHAPLVLHYARLGTDGATEAAAAAAKNFKKSIDGFMADVSDKYEQTAIKSVKDKYGEGWRTNLQNALGDAVVYAHNELGYGDPKGFADEAGEKTFAKIARVIDESKDSSPDDVFRFQKRLNMALRSAQGKDSSLTAALSRIKGDLVKHLETVMPEIQQGNTIYRAGKEIQDGLSKVENADDAVAVINRALKNKGETMDAIKALTLRSADARDALRDMMAAHAGKEYSRWSRYLPNNGLLGAALIGGAEGASRLGAGAVPAAVGLAAATSPRLYAEAAGALPNALGKSPAIQAVGAVAGSVAARLGLSGMSDRAQKILGYN